MSFVPNTQGRRLVTQFDNAAQAYAFKGAAMPEDHAEIIDNYERARKQLLAHIDKLALDVVDAQEHMRLDR